MSKQIFLIMVLCAWSRYWVNFDVRAQEFEENSPPTITLRFSNFTFATTYVAIDSGDAEGYAATFAKDGSFNNFVGHDALVQFIRGRKDAANFRHWNTNLEITPTAEERRMVLSICCWWMSARNPQRSELRRSTRTN